MDKYPLDRHLLLAVFTLLTLASPNCAFARDSHITRSPEQGQYFRRAGPDDKIPPAADCTAYVPAYSHIYLFESGRIPFAINLSIRNTDIANPIYLKKIEYYAADGKLIESVLSDTWILAPMASATYVIGQHDMRGGAGANFVVQWMSSGAANEPLIETVMAGYRGSKGLSFSSRSVPVGKCPQ